VSERSASTATPASPTRPTRCGALAVFAAAALLAAGAAHHRVRYFRFVSLSSARLQYTSGTCLDFGGVLGPGHFFERLTREDTPRGPVFREASKVVTTFPEHFPVEIDVDTVPCTRLGMPLPLVPASFVESLAFRVDWHRSGATAPADVSVTNVEQQPWTETHQHWRISLQVRSKAIPLSDTLSVTILSAKCGPVATLERNLTAPPDSRPRFSHRPCTPEQADRPRPRCAGR
jgi:hypothetical protein